MTAADAPILGALSVPVKSADPRAMFLRTVLATATMPDGRAVELSQSGATLILQVGEFAEERIVQTISLSELGGAWMRAVDEGEL